MLSLKLCLFILIQFYVYVFGCVGSQLQLVGSSLHHVGSLVSVPRLSSYGVGSVVVPWQWDLISPHA